MQSAVEHDYLGNSQYGMVAVNSSRVGSWFSETELAAVVAAIAKQGNDQLIEIVNFNVRGEQYVIAGALLQLAALRLVLDKLSFAETAAISDAITANHTDKKQVIQSAINHVFAANGPSINVQPQCGQATVPLAGIDVPFHSSLLQSSVSSFRKMLSQRISNNAIDSSALSQCYIPNLTAKPFEISKSYFEQVFKLTGSSVICDILNNWFDNTDMTAELAAALVVKLLAYQFALPVQWISTQNQLFNRFGIACFVEIGTSPVLCGMADKTLQKLYGSNNGIAVLHVDRDKDKVYYAEHTERMDSSSSSSASGTDAASASSPVSASAPSPAFPPQPAAEGPLAQFLSNSEDDVMVSDASVEIADVPLQAINVLHAIVAHKTKQSLSAVSVQNTIKNFVSSKSTLQNEIVGDLHKEFDGKVPDKVKEMPLQEAAAAISTNSTAGIQLGKYTQSLVSQLFSAKMPGGFTVSNMCKILESSYGLGPQRQDAALLVALTMEPSEHLANENAANAWLDTVAKVYVQPAGISFAKKSNGSKAASGGKISAKMMVSSAALESLEKKQQEHAMQQIEVLAHYAGLDLQKSRWLSDKHQAESADNQARLDGIYNEFGNDLIDGVKPRFDAHKIRCYDSYWNWARQKAFEWIQSTVSLGEIKANSELLHYLSNCVHSELVNMLSGMAAVFENAKSNPVLRPALELTKKICSACSKALKHPPAYVEFSKPMQPKTSISSNGSVSYSEIPCKDEPSYTAFIEHIRHQGQVAAQSDDEPLPILHICKRVVDRRSGGVCWKYSSKLSQMYFDSMHSAATTGLSYFGKTALVTGCGRDSIGTEIVCGLLSGSAQVVATYYMHSLAAVKFFEQLYHEHGACGSELILVPFNQGSISDIAQLVDFIYCDVSNKGLGWDLDYVFPFAAVTVIGSFATNLSSQSEFAQHVMLTNVLQLLGAIKTVKEQCKFNSQPSLVIVPLSPNHGAFGGEGLYGKCKIGLETTFNRWTSESWKGYLSIAGTVIGWTCGTGLMSANNIIAQKIEEHGA
ncbi:fatty acid synthase alpha subunit Lsd1 [Coemansia asiatica]|nr:fatty acid synthase alpha subunit Lsd1 [Coemansia asiatica]